MWRVIYELGQCIPNFIDCRKLFGFMGSAHLRDCLIYDTLPREL